MQLLFFIQMNNVKTFNEQIKLNRLLNNPYGLFEISLWVECDQNMQLIEFFPFF